MDVALIILDGWGISSVSDRNAVRAANTPIFDEMCKKNTHNTLETWGRSVGLPENGVGNSKVGHLTIGAGRIIEQEHTLINGAMFSGSFFKNEALKFAIDKAEINDKRVHIIGLLSDAGVHSDDAHIHAMIKMVADRGIEAITHVITDGRDTSPTSSRKYIERLEDVIEKRQTGKIASVIGRYYAMDRDKNLERTLAAYETIIEKKSDYVSETGKIAVEDAYHRGETDEFIKPTVIKTGEGFQEGDVICMFNFRADRMRQITHMCGEKLQFDRKVKSEIITLTEYDNRGFFPVAFEVIKPKNTLGEIISKEGLSQLRIAETEKYAHVTYFINGGREEMWDGEIRRIVPSPKVPTYDKKPEMNAEGVTNAAIDIIGKIDPNVLILNYANPDMVGHTGVFESAVKAVEKVDIELGKLTEFLINKNTEIIIIADHGNAEDMGTKMDPCTSHTFNPVPCVYISGKGDSMDKKMRSGGNLSDVAPTIIGLLGIEKPVEMTGESLLK